jgi:hypothetical protein
MRYNNSVVTREDFERELRKMDNEKLSRYSRSINSKWLAYINGYDSDYDANPKSGQTE